MRGRELTLTNLDKVIYPETGTTKADVLAYYAAVAPVLIPAAADRPATRKRWVNGVGTAEEPGEVFFQKNLEDSAPGWVPRAAITHKDRTNHYPLVNDPATLTWLAQISSLEIHVPAVAGGLPRQRTAPGPAGAGPGSRRRRRPGGVRGSGQAGPHHPAGRGPGSRARDQRQQRHPPVRRPWTGPRPRTRSPLSPANWRGALEADHPDLAVSDMKKTLRTGKVLVDWSQNNAAKTTIVPYSLRGRLHAHGGGTADLAGAQLRRAPAPGLPGGDAAGGRTARTRSPPIVRRSARPRASCRGGPCGSTGLADGRTDRRPATAATPTRLEKYRSMRDQAGDAGALHRGTAPRRKQRRDTAGNVRDPGAPRQPAALRLPAGA